MKFVKGQSGNPRGRPKKSREVQTLAREDTLEAYNRVKNLMRTTKDQKLALECARFIVERAWGKPKTAVEHTGKDGGPIEAAMSDTEAARLIAFTLSKAAQSETKASEPETANPELPSAQPTLQ